MIRGLQASYKSALEILADIRFVLVEEEIDSYIECECPYFFVVLWIIEWLIVDECVNW